MIGKHPLGDQQQPHSPWPTSPMRRMLSLQPIDHDGSTDPERPRD